MRNEILSSSSSSIGGRLRYIPTSASFISGPASSIWLSTHYLKAKALAPGVPGIRLNLGLAYFRKHEFKHAATLF